MRKLLSAFLVVGLCAASGRARAGGPICRDLTGPRLVALVHDRVSSAFAGALGLRRGLLPFFADDVLVLFPRQPIVRGKAAAQTLFAGLDPTDGERLTWVPTRIDASVDDRLATSWGSTSTTIANADGTTATQLGKNIIVWRRDLGQPWRIAVYLQINSSVASGPPPAGFGLFPDDRVRCAAPVDRYAEAARLMATDDAFAAESVNENFAVAFRDFAAPDGAIRAGADIIVGPDAIFAAESPFLDPDEVIDWSASDGDVAASGDLGFTVGLIVDDVKDPGTPEDIGFSKYVTVWQKQPDGNWRFVIDGSNIAPAPSP